MRPTIQKSDIMCVLGLCQDDNEEDKKSLDCSECSTSYHHTCLKQLGFHAKRIPGADGWKCWLCDPKKRSSAPRELLERLGIEGSGLRKTPKPVQQSTRRIKKLETRKNRHQSPQGSVSEAGKASTSKEIVHVGSKFPDELEGSSSASPRFVTPLDTIFQLSE